VRERGPLSRRWVKENELYERVLEPWERACPKNFFHLPL